MTDADSDTDFKMWGRVSLEQFAREAAEANRELRADLRTALDAYRKLVSETAA